MANAPFALPGTELLASARHTAFYDRYRSQYAQSLAFLQRELQQCAGRRDRERSRAEPWLAERRELVAKLSGFDQIYAPVTEVETQALANQANSYQVRLGNGLCFNGLYWEPATNKARAQVILGGNDPTNLVDQISHYLACGIRVVMPCLAGAHHSYANHPERKWYFFADDELLNLMFFVVGGSLAGLEAVELLAVSQALSTSGSERLPLALHLRDRHALTAALAAALAPHLTPAGVSPIDLLVVEKEAALLDHQEADVRVNTIWGFHQHFDGLTLLQLAQKTNFLFIEAEATPSAFYSRARIWLDAVDDAGAPASTDDQPRPSVKRLVTPTPSELAGHVAKLLLSETGRSNQPPLPVSATPISASEWDAAYRSAIDIKFSFLETLHQEAQRQRQQRYDLATLTPDEYRARVAASLETVAGPELPAAPDRQPRTRCAGHFAAYDLYEVILSSVAFAGATHQGQSDGDQVEVAGYLLLPTGGVPVPAVICQHGLGGRPDALVGFDDRFEGQWVYDQFARRLAEKGYVVFVPFMNWGWPLVTLRDALVKHAYPLGYASNCFEVAQLHAIVDFLQARPEVSAERIAFYGLSYGGHASLWLCAREPRLAAVVTAGHFNDWQPKLTSTEISPPQERPTSFLTVDEGYDMFNYNVLRELGHAELATRFAPRPQFVENGLFDSVTPTAWVDREFARVQAVFTWLNAPQNAELEHFQGPHRVWSEGSFHFLARHLHKKPAD